MSFLNKIVIITGASSGIGAVTAISFAKEGAKLTITGRNLENLINVALKCHSVSPNGLKPIIVVADIVKESEVSKIVESTVKQNQGIDILVNNAGILESGTIETASIEQYDLVMNTNMRSVYQLTKLATPYLIESKGSIVNVSSVAGCRSFPGILTYSLSKATLDQFTKCVALELAAKGVRVNSVNPAVIDTGIHLKGYMNEEEYKIYLEKCKEHTHSAEQANQKKWQMQFYSWLEVELLSLLELFWGSTEAEILCVPGELI